MSCWINCEPDGLKFHLVLLASTLLILYSASMAALGSSSSSSPELPLAFAQGVYPLNIENVSLADPGGQPLDKCQPSDELVMVAVTLKNLSNSSQHVTTIVELMANDSGITNLLQWQTMTINPNAASQMAISFHPFHHPLSSDYSTTTDTNGTLAHKSSSSSSVYNTKVFVWSNVLEPVPLSAPFEIHLSC